MEVRLLTPPDREAVLEASPLFDAPAALANLARERGCYGMWVLTDADNTAARATYRASGATTESSHVMFAWEWKD